MYALDSYVSPIIARISGGLPCEMCSIGRESMLILPVAIMNINCFGPLIPSVSICCVSTSVSPGFLSEGAIEIVVDLVSNENFQPMVEVVGMLPSHGAECCRDHGRRN